MAKIITILLISSFLFGCFGAFYTAPGWSPYIGCSQYELETNWGRSWDCSYYVGPGIKQCWYSRCMWTGMISPCYEHMDSSNILVTIDVRKSEIMDISYH